MNDELDSAAGTHIDRRSLLKKAGAAGALGLAVPISFDSFFSPAAACSQPVTGSLLRSFTSTTNATSYSITPTFTATAGSLVVIFVAATRASNQSGTVTSITGSAITGSASLRTSVQYDATTGSRADLYAFTATPSGVSGSLTILFAGTRTGIAVQVLQINNVGVGAPLQANAASGLNSTTATVTFASPVTTGTAQVTAFAGSDATAHTWTTPGTELADVFVDGGANEERFSLASGYRDPSQLTNSATATTAVDEWGAVAMELSCP